MLDSVPFKHELYSFVVYRNICSSTSLWETSSLHDLNIFDCSDVRNKRNYFVYLLHMIPFEISSYHNATDR